MTSAVALPATEDGQTVTFRHGSIAWFETLTITIMSTAVALWAGAGGPLSFQASCIWLVGPFVCGLRRGSQHGIASAAASLALVPIWLWYLRQTFAWPPLTDAAAIILVGGAAGEISDWWRRRLGCLEAEGRYYRLRLEEFSREYHSLRLSHSCLEQKLAAGGASLRNALLQLNQRTLRTHAATDDPLGGLGNVILRVFAEHAPLRMAALYACGKPGHFTLCAGLGEPPALSASDILMERALRTGQVASIHSLVAGDVEGVIAVVPLTDINGQTRAALAIYDIPYAAFQSSTLNLLAVIGAHVGDLLMRNAHAIAPDWARQHFISALRRCMEDHRRCALPFTLIVFKFNPATVDTPIAATVMSSRGIDHTYTCDDNAGNPAVLKLLPLTDVAGATCYLRRLASAAQLENDSFEDAGIAHFLWSVSGTKGRRESLLDFSERCGVRLLCSSSDNLDQEEKVAQS